MIRWTSRCEVVYGHWADYIEAIQEVNRLCVARGMTEAQLFNPLMGKNNILVMSCDFESYEDMKREQAQFDADAEIMKAWRTCAQYTVQGSETSELLEPL